MQYTGSKDAICPITHQPLSRLEHPVVFKHNTAQPYECEALARWLTIRRTDPITNLPVHWQHNASEIIAPIGEDFTETLLESLSHVGKFMIVAHIYNLRISELRTADMPVSINMLHQRWPDPPLDVSLASFACIDSNTGWVNLNWNGAEFGEETMIFHGNQTALLIHHGPLFTITRRTIQCLVVFEINGNEKRLHLVHVPFFAEELTRLETANEPR